MRAALFALCSVVLAAPPLRADPAPTPPRPAANNAIAAPAPLPVPSPSGKPLATTPAQRTVRVPLSFARVERFYRDQLGPAAPRVTIVVERTPEGRVLTLTSRREGDAWSRAVAREGAVDTTIEITPVVRAGIIDVQGRAAGPSVQFVMPPNPEVARQADTIDHLVPPR